MYKKTGCKITLITSTLLTAVLLTTGFANNAKANTITYKNISAENQAYARPAAVSSDEALQFLIEGNKRYVANKALSPDISYARRKNLSTYGQKPFAIILSCSDSRVPPELVFNQGLGDLFVVRNAGNVVDPVALGSIEYGAEHLKAPLIVVLGHEKCGAVKAAMEGAEASEAITAIMDKIKPSYEKVKASTQNADELYDKTIDENIRASIAAISKSPVIQKLSKEQKIDIVGAKYHMDTGKVTFDIEKGAN
jgi:carbonic anhydrase